MISGSMNASKTSATGFRMSNSAFAVGGFFNSILASQCLWEISLPGNAGAIIDLGELGIGATVIQWHRHLSIGNYGDYAIHGSDYHMLVEVRRMKAPQSQYSASRISRFITIPKP